MLTTPKDFLIRTCSCLRHYDYMSKTDALIKSLKSTSQIVWESRHIDIKNAEIFSYIQEVTDMLCWVNTLNASKYDVLLKNICNKSTITESDMSLLCSCVIAYRRSIDVNTMNARIAAMVTVNDWPYTIGDKLKGDGQIIYIDDSLKFKKRSWCVRLIDHSGVMLVYYTNINPNYKINELVAYDGKVKALGITDNNIKYTHIIC